MFSNLVCSEAETGKLSVKACRANEEWIGFEMVSTDRRVGGPLACFHWRMPIR